MDKDIPVYIFSVGREELEILVKMVQRAYENTPDVFEIMQFRGRLRNLTKTFGRIWVEQVKGKTLPSKYVNKTHKKIKENLK